MTKNAKLLMEHNAQRLMARIDRLAEYRPDPSLDPEDQPLRLNALRSKPLLSCLKMVLENAVARDDAAGLTMVAEALKMIEAAQ